MDWPVRAGAPAASLEHSQAVLTKCLLSHHSGSDYNAEPGVPEGRAPAACSRWSCPNGYESTSYKIILPASLCLPHQELKEIIVKVTNKYSSASKQGFTCHFQKPPPKGMRLPEALTTIWKRTFETNIASLPPPFLPCLHLHLLLLHHLWDWLWLFTWVCVGSGRVQETVKPVIPWPLLLCLGCSACILNFLDLEIP